jgi:HD-GYP domain-containing protein (c-di-GMP phosphodiesterase class II)
MEETTEMQAELEHPAMLLLGSDPEVAAHGRAVARIALKIADALDICGRPREMLGVAAGLHDIGKLPMPDETLHKPGPLEPSEWVQIRLHPVFGEQLVVSAGLDEIAPWVRHHHERPDGLGYPDGLGGDTIPLESRIIAVGDAYDAMVSERPYSSALTPAAAREELLRGAGTQFDAEIVGTFLDLPDARPWMRRFRRGRTLHAVA